MRVEQDVSHLGAAPRLDRKELHRNCPVELPPVLALKHIRRVDAEPALIGKDHERCRGRSSPGSGRKLGCLIRCPWPGLGFASGFYSATQLQRNPLLLQSIDLSNSCNHQNLFLKSTCRGWRGLRPNAVPDDIGLTGINTSFDNKGSPAQIIVSHPYQLNSPFPKREFACQPTGSSFLCDMPAEDPNPEGMFTLA